MLAESEKSLIVNSWRLVVPIAETAADLFYRRLFELRPEYRSLFAEDMSRQKQKLVKMLAFIVKSLDWPADEWNRDIDAESDLFLVVAALGRRHAKLYAIPDEAYAPVGESLIWTLEQGLGDALTPDIKSAWLRVYTLLASAMKLAGKAERLPVEDGKPELAAWKKRRQASA